MGTCARYCLFTLKILKNFLAVKFLKKYFKIMLALKIQKNNQIQPQSNSKN